MRGSWEVLPMRDKRTNDKQVKIALLSQWKLEAGAILHQLQNYIKCKDSIIPDLNPNQKIRPQVQVWENVSCVRCPVGAASTAGCCLGSCHAPLPPIHGHIRTQCSRMEWTVDTWRPQTREHKDLWQTYTFDFVSVGIGYAQGTRMESKYKEDEATKKRSIRIWLRLQTCQSEMLTALAVRVGSQPSRETANSLVAPLHIQNTINATYTLNFPHIYLNIHHLFYGKSSQSRSVFYSLSDLLNTNTIMAKQQFCRHNCPSMTHGPWVAWLLVHTNMHIAQVSKLGNFCDLFTFTCCAFNKGKGVTFSG